MSRPAAWPSLAGQDAQYLADAIKGYKHGSRNKAIACAACHGEGGVSRRPGMPSLVGLTPQYLVIAMKAYVSGDRKNEFKKALLIPSEIGEDFKRQRDRFISAVDDIRRFIVTNHRVRIGVLKDAQAITRAQRHYRSGASAINEIASSSAVPNQLY